MKLERFIYLDATGIASLYSQLRGEDVIETLFSMENSRASRWKAALSTFIVGSAESNASIKESTARKVSLRAENMLREITASLRANGTLCRSISDAIASTSRSSEPAWFEARHPFAMPLQISQCDAVFFRQIGSALHPYNIFGSLFRSGEDFQVKPYAIRV